MPKYLFNPGAPQGWAVDETGHFVQVPENYVRSGEEFIKGPDKIKGMEQNANTPKAAWVDELYKKYFDRSATDAEMANWWNVQPQELETFLQSEQEKYGYVPNEQRAANDASLKAALDMIDADPNIPIAMKGYAKDIVAAYDGDAQANFDDIMDTFNKLKTETIDPYYANQMNFLQKGFETSFNNLQENRKLELEAQNAAAARAVAGTQEDLEARGLTNSGKAVELLGQSSALPGIFTEGAVPQTNRILASSSDLRYQQNLSNLGRQQEATLGSGAGLIQGYAAAGGLTGSVQEQRNQALGGAIGGLFDQQVARDSLNKTQGLDLTKTK